MRCINAVDGFRHGFEFAAVDNSLFHLCGSASMLLGKLTVSDFIAMRQAGHATAEQMVIRFGAGMNKAARKNEYNKVSVERASVAMVDNQIVFLAEADEDAEGKNSDLLVLFQSDHLKYQDSGLAALDGAVVLSRSLLADGKHEIVLAKMPPGSALRAYIDHRDGKSVRRQYISNLALCGEGRELMSHG